ncbi:MAG: cytochrome c biogenesis protein ResB, partial [Desulfuromonadales bacterium]|nr:cytochrome c biogenesis protein ResB [Desulfuromonadales bacterium]NIR33580.1 cytochrome c biogenesis protein ResB [Desulfuromonadales bacterium]NIS39721.1 cytochrome c biogenesis protein ResB [Desulfuromonadales bacterium]
MIIRFLTSLKLTLALLLGLSAISIVGTIKPGALGRYDLFYQSFWFRSILALLALHLSVCTIKTIARNLGDRRRFLDLLGGEQVFARPLRYVLPGHVDVEAVGEGLRQIGYRIYPNGTRIYARRNPWGRWGSTIVHLSFLGIMLGALLAEAGFVGTLNIYVGDKSPVYFDWESQEDRPLPFEFRLDYFEPVYYPIELRFGVLDNEGNRLKAYNVKEGATVQLPVRGYSARVTKFLPYEKQIVLGVYRNGRYLGEYHASADEKRYAGEGEL